MPVEIATEKFMNSLHHTTHCTPYLMRRVKENIQFYSNTDLNSIRNHLIPLQTRNRTKNSFAHFICFFHLLIQRYGRTKIQFTFLFNLQGLLLIYAFFFCCCKMEMKAISCSLTSRLIHVLTLLIMIYSLCEITFSTFK